MLTALRNAWPLLIGMFMLMIGNGLQATVLGVRGGYEEFSDSTLGYVMSGYFVGFLGGTWATPWMLRRVGHVRVFAALASLISAAFILYGALVDPLAWFFLRLIVGFCFSGVYVVAESWLNDGATNETRGQTMSAYIIVQMLGIILAQALLNFGDPGGYDLFVVMSVLVSISFAPILLSSSPAPVFERTRAMTLARLYRTSPLGCVAIFILGAVFAVQFGMSAVYAASQGFSRLQISIFIGAIYIGGLLCQWPIGWISDRVDRRKLIAGMTAAGAVAALLVPVAGHVFPVIVVTGFLLGGIANPLYSLVVAYVNDYLENEDMPAASAGLIMLNGIGAMGAPVLVGYLMDTVADDAFFLFFSAAFSAITAYALWRMTRRAVKIVGEQAPVVPMSQVSSPLAADVAIEAAMEQAREDRDDGSELATQGARDARP